MHVGVHQQALQVAEHPKWPGRGHVIAVHFATPINVKAGEISEPGRMFINTIERLSLKQINFYTSQTVLHTLHYTPHPAFSIPHSTFHTSSSTLYTSDFTPGTPHSALHTPHSPFLTPHSTLHTTPSRFLLGLHVKKCQACDRMTSHNVKTARFAARGELLGASRRQRAANNPRPLLRK